MGSKLTNGRVTINVVTIVVGAIMACYWMKIKEPITLGQRNLFDFLLKKIKFVQYQQEFHFLQKKLDV